MKKILCFITALLLTISLPLSVQATTDASRVVDDANLLTDSQEKSLESKIDKIIKKYKFDVVIVTNKSLDGQSAENYADDYYDDNDYGIGNRSDGILFLFSTQHKDYWTSSYAYGITAFTDYGINYIHDQVTPLLREKKYYEAFDKYVDLADKFLAEAKDGKPYDTSHKILGTMDYVKYEAIIVAVSLVLALVIVIVMKIKMNTAIKRSTAQEYIRDGSMNLYVKKDVYMYSNTTKIKIESNSSSGGGSSTHTSSSGRSHGGGGGRL